MTKKTLILSAATAIALGAVGTYAATRPSDAQDAPTLQMADGSRTGDSPDQQRHGWGIEGRHGPQHHHWMMAHRGWGLFYPVVTKNLTVADVQTIAQAVLLRHGNHTWKVADVTGNQDNTVSFAFTTADGGVVARFAVDTQTGRLRRIG
jgi:phage baseplate assembly protein gpV